MNRSELFVSLLALNSTILAPVLMAYESKPSTAAPRAVKSSTPARSTERHPDAKCGRCVPAVQDRRSEKGRESTGRETRRPTGGKPTFGRDGHVLEAHGREPEIRPERDGRRETRTERADHSVLVASRGGRGYIEHGYWYHGHEFARRSYYVHGVPYAAFYQPYYYRGIHFHVYVPGFYFTPAFYGWAYNPWAAPVDWDWGWAGRPWYRFYGSWFRPSLTYASPSLWLTDYLVADTLEAAYEARNVAAPAGRATDPASLTPEVKRAIADEVRRQLALENVEAKAGSRTPPDPGSSGLARMLSDGTAHVFVVAADLQAMSDRGACSLTGGDAIQLSGPSDAAAVTARLVVLAGKGGDCRKGSVVTVGLADLQEMQNHLRQTIDWGLVELHAKQGRLGGPPPAPPAAAMPPVQTAFGAIAPPLDPNGEMELKRQQAENGKLDEDPTSKK